MGKKLTSKTRFQPIMRFWKSINNAHLKSDTSKNNFEARIIFPFSQKIKRKQKYEKEGQDIHIYRISTTFGCQQVNFLIFPDIRQSAAIVKTKVEVFIKNIDWMTIDIAISRNWNINRT